MKARKIERDNFTWTYYECPNPTNKAIILSLGGYSDKRPIFKAAAQYLTEIGTNVVTFLPVQGSEKYSGWKNFPIERAEDIVAWLRTEGNEKIGVAGASTTSAVSLTLASRIPDISIVFAFAVMDFLFQGFNVGKRADGIKEWPEENSSMLSYRGEPVPYSPFHMTPKEYDALAWGRADSKPGDYNFLGWCEHIEKQPDFENGLIPVENAHAKIYAFGAKDDTGCPAVMHIQRMGDRLARAGYQYGYEPHIYEHCSHYIFPEGMVRHILPIGSSLLFGRMFKSERLYPKECAEARKDVDSVVRNAVLEW